MKGKYKWVLRSDELPKPIAFRGRRELDEWVTKNRHVNPAGIWVTYYDRKAKAEITYNYSRAR